MKKLNIIILIIILTIILSVGFVPATAQTTGPETTTEGPFPDDWWLDTYNNCHTSDCWKMLGPRDNKSYKDRINKYATPDMCWHWDREGWVEIWYKNYYPPQTVVTFPTDIFGILIREEAIPWTMRHTGGNLVRQWVFFSPGTTFHCINTITQGSAFDSWIDGVRAPAKYKNIIFFTHLEKTFSWPIPPH